MKESNLFSSKIGFILAAAGSAVGLGNLWRFPYLAAKYGGGIFLFVYIILALTFGFTLTITEIALGRKTGKSTVSAFKELDKRYAFIGYLETAVPCIILPYYCVIGGWVIKYFSAFIAGKGTVTAGDSYFTEYISGTSQPLIWMFIFLGVTAAIVSLGVSKGIEKASKILMPVLVILSLFVAVYSVTRPGAFEGVVFYLKPDFTKISVELVFAALGQLFYSMSLAMGIMITYGSYVNKKSNLEQSVKQIEIFDTGIAIMAGLIIIPAVFAFSGGDESVLSSGPSLMFITLPKVFHSMAFGDVFGTVFFLLVLFAALTSAISLMEVVVAMFQEKTRLSRKMICILVTILGVLIAVPSSLGFGVWSGVSIIGLSILDFFDFISNSVLMPVVGLLTCLFIGFVVKPDIVCDEVKQSGDFKKEKMYRIMIKYVTPVFITMILISSVLMGLGIIRL